MNKLYENKVLIQVEKKVWKWFNKDNDDDDGVESDVWLGPQCTSPRLKGLYSKDQGSANVQFKNNWKEKISLNDRDGDGDYVHTYQH